MKRTEVYSLIRSGQYAEAIKLLALEVQEPVGVSGPAVVFDALKSHCYDKQESFFVITLDSSHQIIKAHTITTGIVNRTIVHPREVFRPCLEDNAAFLMVAHNHPSGKLEPSPEDIDMTRRIKEAGEIMDITLLDHIILGKVRGVPSWISMLKTGAFPR